MPMSASCVVNRAELLAMLEEVRQALPGSLAQAQELLGGQEQFAEQARQEAGRIIESAHAQRATLISETEVARRSQAEADRILSEARREADEVRAEADDYVDSKLANFEVVLTKTIGSVDRGREKLLGRGQGLDEQGYEDPDYTEAPNAAPTRRPCGSGRTRTSTPSSVPSRPCSPRPWRRSAAAGRSCTAGSPPTTSARTSPPRTPRAARATPATPTTWPASPSSPPGTAAGAPAARPARLPGPAAGRAGLRAAGVRLPGAAAPPGRPGRVRLPAAARPVRRLPAAGRLRPERLPAPAGRAARLRLAPAVPSAPAVPGVRPARRWSAGRDSLFDTSMIDLEQLRRYEQGR